MQLYIKYILNCNRLTIKFIHLGLQTVVADIYAIERIGCKRRFTKKKRVLY